MKIYIVMVNDRHNDPQPHPFSGLDSAIEWAQAYYQNSLREDAVDMEDDEELGEQELTDAMRRGGWLYHARYSVEGDSVWVVERTLDQPEEDQ